MDKSAPVLTEFVVGKTSFLSRGFSVIKLTDDGEEKLLKLPIKSIGIVALQEELRKDEPRPPEKTIVIKVDSPQGKALSLDRDTPVISLDMSDREYLQALEQYRRDLMWRTAVMALDIIFRDTDGKEITDPARIKEALQASGITGHHLDQIIIDVNGLTARREARADFLSGNALA